MSIFLTATGISALNAGCGSSLFNNDWKNHSAAPSSAYDAQAGVGSAARELLVSDHFKSLNIEIQAMPGMAPTQETRNRLQRFLELQLNKPGGIQLLQSEEIATAHMSYSVSDIRNLEDRHRRHFTKKDQLTVYILFVDNHSVDDQPGARLLGQAHRGSSIVIYENTIREEVAKLPGLSLSLVETTVLEHEFGHLMGLVNLGVAGATPEHEDPKNLSHCSEKKCLMNYAVENSANLQSMLNGDVPELDSLCKATLRSAGGK